jgi:hypothetical protein
MRRENPMSTRDVATDFCYQPPTPTSPEVVSTSIVGPAGTYLAPNSIDTGGVAGYLSALSAADTLLTVGGITYFRDVGGGESLTLVIDWTTGVQGSGTVDMQLLSSAFANISAPWPVVDFGAVPVATLQQGYRQTLPLPRSNTLTRYLQFLGLQAITSGTITQGSYVAWLALNYESEFLGYADGFQVL